MGTKADSAPCPDPSCRGRAEPEQDGDLTYMECLECGFAFGFTRSGSRDVKPAAPTPVGKPEPHAVSR